MPAARLNRWVVMPTGTGSGYLASWRIVKARAVAIRVPGKAAKDPRAFRNELKGPAGWYGARACPCCSHPCSGQGCQGPPAMGLLAFVKVWAMLRAADCRRAGVGTGPDFIVVAGVNPGVNHALE